MEKQVETYFSLTNLTPDGGFFMAFTTLISSCLSVLRASVAALRAGTALANSFSQSSLIAWASANFLLATASSAATNCQQRILIIAI